MSLEEVKGGGMAGLVISVKQLRQIASRRPPPPQEALVVVDRSPAELVLVTYAAGGKTANLLDLRPEGRDDEGVGGVARGCASVSTSAIRSSRRGGRMNCSSNLWSSLDGLVLCRRICI